MQGGAMKFYTIPCAWEVYATVEVAANSLAEAIEKVEDDEFPLPSNFNYIDGSFAVDIPIAEELHNENA